MKVEQTALPGVLMIEPRVFADERGFFMETWNAARYREAGIPADFAQANHARSARGVLRGLHYVLGWHPASNVSFVSGVGIRSKKVAYGSNRADFSFIAGGVVPGVLILKPDFPESKEDWPFLWGENEYVIDICAHYILLANMANDLVGRHP